MSSHLNNPNISSDSYIETVVKTVDESVANSNVLQDDDELQVTVEANKVYGFIAYIRATYTVNGDYKLGFAVPAGATCSAVFGGDIGGLASYLTELTQRDLTSAVTATTGATDKALILIGSVVTGGAAGSLKFQFAQGTSHADNTTVKAGSWLALFRNN